MILAGKIYTPEKCIVDGAIVVRDGKITEVTEKHALNAEGGYESFRPF